ncbi:hypothetical protein [Paludibaculum fermentans]|uniref:Uncharacterized protein n=1 Tax=Paludibaculum fermentans TaxID=1473598 RepID=A0A7S7NRS3_PALFE|nr:hypothetical protein [Paludibaculum fermentans]QOY88623.1 hypothetical protein IRI77_01285 [Paludibaculum fermentans]
MKYVSAMLVAAALLLAGVAMLGQDLKHGWKMHRTDRADEVQFTVERWKDGNHWSNSRPYPLTSFRGFSTSWFDHGGKVKFSFVQDAGELQCEGGFSFGRGSGNFTFTPNPSFVSRLKELGYDEPDSNDLFAILLAEVSLDFAREVKDAGLGASTKQLIELRIHGVSGDYIREAREAGYRDFSARDYTQLRIHGVNTDFLRDLQRAGYNLPAGDITELRIHGVSAEFAKDLKSAGYDLPTRQITELRIHGVSSDYLRDLRTYGLRPEAGDLKELRIHGVSPQYLKGLKDSGYAALPAREITELHMRGVSTNFIREAHDLGYSFTPRELSELCTQGVNGAYLRKLKESGMKNLSASQIAKLRVHGVE